MGMDSRPWYNGLNGFIVQLGWTYCNLCWWGELGTIFTYLWCPEISVGYKGKGVCSEFDHVLCYNVIATLQPGSGIQGVSTVWIFYVYTLCLSCKCGACNYFILCTCLGQQADTLMCNLQLCKLIIPTCSSGSHTRLFLLSFPVLLLKRPL